jgi:predicted NBD/HSP70 family sugar kinase
VKTQKPKLGTQPKKVLVVDVGGTNVKILATGHQQRVKFPSGQNLKPSELVSKVKAATVGWKYNVVSLGYPGVVIHGRPTKEPLNLGSGWVHFDFKKAFGRPVKIVNDAGMQALGSYHGGRMLFLGLGTGLGSAVIEEGMLISMELGHLPFKSGKTYEDFIGNSGLKKSGKKKWLHRVNKVAEQLKNAMLADYVVLGGGNARLLKKLPINVLVGNNLNAFKGGYRLWNRNDRNARHKILVP